MGNIQLSTPIVQDWGNSEAKKVHTNAMFDTIEIRTENKFTLKGIGLVRPLQGSSQITLTIMSASGNGMVYHERFINEVNFLQKSYIQPLRETIILEPKNVYKISIYYEGSNCYTYKESRDIVKIHESEVHIRRREGLFSEGGYRQANLITDLQWQLPYYLSTCLSDRRVLGL